LCVCVLCGGGLGGGGGGGGGGEYYILLTVEREQKCASICFQNVPILFFQQKESSIYAPALQ
jgi:hypothetical protein